MMIMINNYWNNIRFSSYFIFAREKRYLKRLFKTNKFKYVFDTALVDIKDKKFYLSLMCVTGNPAVVDYMKKIILKQEFEPVKELVTVGLKLDQFEIKSV